MLSRYLQKHAELLRGFGIRRLFHELEFLFVGNQAAFVGLGEEAADGFAAFVAVIERPVVDIHADEFVGEVFAHVAGVLEGVLDGFGAMFEAVADAGFENAGDGAAIGFGEAFVDDVAAEWEREAVVLAAPPDAEVFAEDEAFVAVGELAFVDDQADVGAAVANGGEDLVEGDDDEVEVFGGLAEVELEREEGAGHGAGDGDFLFGDFFFREFLFGDEHGAVAVAHAGAAGEEGVLVADVGVGVDGNGGDVEFAAGSTFVEGLDVLEDVFETKAVRGDEVFGERVKHERVVRIGRVAKREQAIFHRHRACGKLGTSDNEIQLFTYEKA
jgi:hypothetical protein